jgi:antitoxin component of MazEF toxin-antitoxin module
MIKKLTRTGNSVALILDKTILDQLGLDENAEVELFTNGQVLIVTPRRGPARERKFREIVDEINKKYAGVFRRLSDS